MNRIGILIAALCCCACAAFFCGCTPRRDVARLESTIPASPAYTHIVFRAYVDELTLSIGGRRVYAFRDVQSRGRLTVHVVALPPDSAGKRVQFDIARPTSPNATLIGARYLANAETLPFAIERATISPLRENADDIVLGFIFVIVGAIACVLALIRRRGDTLAMGSFGAFTLLYGLRLMVDSSLPYSLGLSWSAIEFTEAFITYIIPIAGWALPVRLIGNGWKSSLRWQVLVFTIFAPIGILSDVVTGRPFSLEIVNNILVVIGGINIIVNLLLAEHRGTLELRVLLLGSAVFMLFALNNNLTNLGVLPWSYDAEAPGFVLFVAALGFAATRAFTRGERESVAIENELRTAREIQQSILPRAMPQKSGLHFDAAYLPATSVGGDMYSFLDRDDGAGVLVADVAGHGVPAALIASMVKIAVSTQARVADDPAALIGELNAILRRDVRRAFVTATYLWLDIAERRVVACNAGHPPPLLLRNGTFIELGASGVLLGRFDARYTATSTPLEDGDRIVAYTDGIPEARNARGEMFGEERLRELVLAGSSAQTVVDAVRKWRGDTIEDVDDLTIVMIEWNAGVPGGETPPSQPARTPALLLSFLLLFACHAPEAPAPARPHILLVTLDTTRFDAIGANTPSFNALAQRSRNFRYAYATAPQTLPSHSSMLTGLYPGGHRVHENARYLDAQHPLVAEKLQAAGYRTAAFVSAFPLARRFGLARGFETYDDPEQNERDAKATTDRAIAWLAQSQSPTFLWVHYYDPHFPYVPNYAGEIKSMDTQLGRLVSAYEKLAGDKAIIVVADHGESLGEHGEKEHGNLLYQSVMHVPLLVSGPGVKPETIEQPVSTRRVFHTILDFAGIAKALTLRETTNEVVLGEAMGPFLQYGWLPQVMAVEGRYKAIFAGLIEVYDVVADPAEQDQFGSSANLTREMRKALLEYPVPSLTTTPPPALDDEARKRLASLGYITSDTKPVIPKDAPRPRDMTDLFEILDEASSAFVRGDYAAAIPLLERVVAADPHNVTSILRIAAAHSALGHNDEALTAFRRAEAIAPNSPDVRHYLALHYARVGNWDEATPLLERVVAEDPDRLPALEALAESRERNGRIPEALQLWKKIHSMRATTPAELARVGQMAMAVGDTPLAIESFERAGKGHDLELGVLYLAARRFADARDALDRVPVSHPEYPMALFKRAQVSVLLNEPDRAARIAKAKERADETTRALIANEKLFRN